MEKFIVLGQVPGTDIQITFTLWLELMTAVMLLVVLMLLFVSHRQQLAGENDSDQRAPMHARQLHR
ncbi:MAG: hypothetical protein JWM81_388 [Candidatus Saccharibacteria bacterium]|nr:hypothetical protein [Candidatus Saccharibacteria bacterium]